MWLIRADSCPPHHQRPQMQTCWVGYARCSSRCVCVCVWERSSSPFFQVLLFLILHSSEKLQLPLISGNSPLALKSASSEMHRGSDPVFLSPAGKLWVCFSSPCSWVWGRSVRRKMKEWDHPDIVFHVHGWIQASICAAGWLLSPADGDLAAAALLSGSY